MTEQLKSLSDRLEGLIGADRATDALIAQAVEKPTNHLNGMTFDEAIDRFPHDRSGIAMHWPIPPFTESVDDAMALVERLYPLHEIVLTRRTWIQGITWEVELGEGRQVEAPTAPLALLRALLAAKIEEAEHE